MSNATYNTLATAFGTRLAAYGGVEGPTADAAIAAWVFTTLPAGAAPSIAAKAEDVAVLAFHAQRAAMALEGQYVAEAEERRANLVGLAAHCARRSGT